MSALALEPLVSGRGVTDWFSVATPAAGANTSFSVASRNVAGLRVVAGLATLSTDATVANRVFSLDYIDARSVTRVRHVATRLETASGGATVFQWDHAHSLSEWNTGTMVYVPLNDVILTPGWLVQLTLDNKQAGDQISAISFVVEAFYADS